MGMHLHLYATRTISPSQIEAWIKYRANDLFETPSEDADEISELMHWLWRTDSQDHMEHGPKIDKWLSDTFVWKVQEVTPQLIASSKLERPMDLQLSQWLEAHHGQRILGDNDGI